jgi:Thioredoxin like C-terminal domain
MTAPWRTPSGLHVVSARLPDEGELPSLAGATGWFNSPPLTPAGLRGTVVLIDFCTYTCVNWLRTVPYVRAWAGKYGEHGLAVVGVHTPEFPFEQDAGNVRWALANIGVDYPVAADNDYAVWEAFGNHYWPALYFADAQGRIRHHYFGEGEYAQSEMIVQQLLTEAGFSGFSRDMVTVDPRGPEVAADWDSVRSAENYTGYERGEGFASPGGALPGQRHAYAAPGRLDLNQWALSGDWTVHGQGVTADAADGRIAYRFHARDLNLVMGPATPGTSVPFQVLLDGQPPGPAHGGDADEQGHGTATEQRLYQLIRQPGQVADRTFEITFAHPGAAAYVFTFG